MQHTFYIFCSDLHNFLSLFSFLFIFALQNRKLLIEIDRDVTKIVFFLLVLLIYLWCLSKSWLYLPYYFMVDRD